MGGRGVKRAGAAVRRQAVRAAATALLAAALAAPAAAVIKVATYTGTVYDGYDTTGEFGAANTDLTGKTFVSRYVYDTSLGYRYTSLYYDQVVGGAELATTDPMLSTTVTIGGVTRRFYSASFEGAAEVLNYECDGCFSEIYHESEDVGDDGIIGHSNIASSIIEFDPNIPINLEENFTSSGGSAASQYVQFDTYNDITGVSLHAATAAANVTSLTVTNGVPEPATWALMIGGFGAVGGAARRRRVALG